MCGIAGFAGDYSPELLTRFTARLHHRGPDDHGTHYDPSQRIGLAHTRLSILDLSARGHQPMIDPATGCVIVYNGELYNFRELRAALIARGHTFRSESDTEVVLRLYLEHGDRLLDHLDGIFAFAVHDPRNGTVLLARDQLGVKPLYVAALAQGVLFASELKALIGIPELPRTVDLHAVDATVRYLWCPGPRTMLSSVEKLEPGTAMIVRHGRVARRWRYFELPVEEPTPSVSAADAPGRLLVLLERAVHDQLVSDVPVGAFLSGGLDSSAIVALAARQVPDLTCFTMRFESGTSAAEGFDDDLPHARRVATALGVPLVEVPVGDDVGDELAQMIAQLDEPQADLAPLNVRRIAAASRQRGIKVLLSGAGGDDLFAGYRRHQAARFESLWTWMPAPLRGWLRRGSSRLPQAAPWSRRIAKAFRHADAPLDARLAGYFDWIDTPRRHTLLTDEARRVVTAHPYEPLRRSLAALRPGIHPVNRVLYLDGRYFLPDHNLNYTDKMAMAEGVEVRVPLLALDVVRFASTLPLEAKIRGSVGKWVLREAMRGVLPDAVLSRSKTGFGVPLRAWLHQGLAPVVADALSSVALRRRGWFEPAAVERLMRDDRSGRIDAAYPILALVCLELWARAFLDPPLASGAGAGMGARVAVPSTSA